MHMHMALGMRRRRYLQFGAELGRNVNLHAAKNGAVEKLGRQQGAKAQVLVEQAGPLAAFTARLAGVLGVDAMPGIGRIASRTSTVVHRRCLIQPSAACVVPAPRSACACRIPVAQANSVHDLPFPRPRGIRPLLRSHPPFPPHPPLCSHIAILCR